MKPDDLDSVTKTLWPLLNLMLENYGPWGTLLIIGVVCGLFVWWRIRQGRGKEQGWKAALEEKERTIQRLANDNRDLRIQLLKERNWTNHDIERLILLNVHPDGAATRRALEDRPRLIENRPQTSENHSLLTVSEDKTL